ncbi:hypothetical protein [Nocardia caishijiensis]|uniref:Type VII secretion system (Wss) protein ESAT-6 n=1 Tax=Nocardia caishijiensis TaxID=184756 RepID=A0ABQ6YRV6_9NOCA|nr:hypothetical protein [Nocardia caishijiensis]KAF0848269.1 hypothetical protein FNL39_102417 [Nocardia caishijiensis]
MATEDSAPAEGMVADPAAATQTAEGETPQTVEEIIRELLEAHGLGSLLDMSVPDALSSLQLPQLPDLSSVAEAASAIPLSSLIEPVLELASAFGTGNTGGSGGSSSGGSGGGSTGGSSSDPTSALSGITDTLSTVVDLAKDALSAATALWEGTGADAAATKSTEVAQNTTDTAAQAEKMNQLVAAGAADVSTGLAEINAVIARFVAGITALAPVLWTPPGQAAAIALANESIAEGVAIVTKTQAALTTKAGEMTAAGQKIAVTEAPNVISGLTTALNVATPLLSMASTGVEALSGLASSATSAVSEGVDAATEAVSTGADVVSSLTDAATQLGETVSSELSEANSLTENLGASTGADDGSTTAPATDPSAASAGAGGGGGGMGMVGMGGMGGLGGMPPSSSPLSSTPLAARQSIDVAAAGQAADSARQTTAGAPGGMVPGAGAARRAGDAGTHDPERTGLVAGSHGDELVGAVSGTSMPVIGADEETFDESSGSLVV